MKRHRQEILILPAMTVLVLLIDQFSKYLVTQWLAVGQSWDIAPWLAPVFSVTYVTNTGAAFGLFPQLGSFFIFIATIVILAIIIYYHQLPDGQWPMRVALGLQLGGALGNLVDRLRQGYVVDFIDLSFWPLHQWPVFNLADASIVTGVTILAILLMWEERLERQRENEPLAESS